MDIVEVILKYLIYSYCVLMSHSMYSPLNCLVVERRYANSLALPNYLHELHVTAG